MLCMFRTGTTMLLVWLCFGAVVFADWPQWRGPGRDAQNAAIPDTLEGIKRVWQRPMAGPNYAGLAAVVREGQTFLLVPDHDPDAKHDLLYCFDDKGQERWRQRFPNAEKIDFGSSPRGTPAIVDQHVYFITAPGILACLELNTGRVVWTRHMVRDLDGALPEWGYSSSLLVHKGLVIVNPGGEKSSLVALDAKTGQTRWQSPGDAASYASFVIATVGGIEQIIGFDEHAIRGWRFDTGRTLWRVEPRDRVEAYVATPVIVDNHLLMCDEIETRLYRFNADGTLAPEPIARNRTVASDVASLTLVGTLALATGNGLTCMDVKDELKTLWNDEVEDEYFSGSHIIARDDLAMIFSEQGFTLLVRITRDGPTVIGKFETSDHTWSHPALVPGRLYVRDKKHLHAYDLPRPRPHPHPRKGDDDTP